MSPALERCQAWTIGAGSARGGDRAWAALVVALATLGMVLLVTPVGDTFVAQDAAYVTTNNEAWAWLER